MPGWTFINEDREISEEELDDIRPTLDALAKEWTAIHHQQEQEGFRRQSMIEEGHDREPDECPECGGAGTVGLGYRNRLIYCQRCHQTPPDHHLYGILCPYCKGEGVDVRAEAEYAKRERRRQAEVEVRIEIIEGMLEKYGCRMMRLYEHYAEHERYFQWMEEGRFGNSTY
jgi:hypothetical protein